MCSFDTCLNRTGVKSDPIVELVVRLVEVDFKGCFKEFIPMMRQYLIFKGVEVFKLCPEFLS